MTKKEVTNSWVMAQVLLTYIFGSLCAIYMNASLSDNGAGLIHWVSLFAGGIGLVSQATILIDRTIKEILS